MFLRYGDTGEEVKLLQRALNEKMSLRLKADGVFGKLTEEAIRSFQRVNSLFESGVYGQNEIDKLSYFISSKYLRASDIEQVAVKEDLPISIVKAIREVEARSDGFLYDGRAVILFERHRFYKELAKATGILNANNISSNYPDICNIQKGGYRGYEEEYLRLNQALNINRECALKATSFGLFQILGSNFRESGYISVDSFYLEQQESEHNQFKAFINFVKSNRSLLLAIKQRNYVRIAELYNGKAQVNLEYSKKLSSADARFVR